MPTRRTANRTTTAKPRARQATRKALTRGDKGAVHGGISNAAVLKATGRAWTAWFKILREFNVKRHGHKAAAAYAHDELQCPPWWSQMVVVAFERATGLREVHQKADGYSASVSRTITVALPTLYKAWQENARAAWLPDPNVNVRKSTLNKSMRITWADSKSRVEINFYDKTGKAGTPKSQVTVQHDKLTSATQVKKMKAYWSAALDALRTQLEA